MRLTLLAVLALGLAARVALGGSPWSAAGVTQCSGGTALLACEGASWDAGVLVGSACGSWAAGNAPRELGKCPATRCGCQ